MRRTAGKDSFSKGWQSRWSARVEQHQAADMRAVERGEFIVCGRLRQQDELRLRRELRETTQQFQHEHLSAAVFAAGKDRREVDQNGSQLIGVAGFQRLHLLAPSCVEPSRPFRVSQSPDWAVLNTPNGSISFPNGSLSFLDHGVPLLDESLELVHSLK